MTIEGVLLILILALALIKAIHYKSYSTILDDVKTQLFSKSRIETAAIFMLTVVLGLSISNQILGIVLFNAVVWSSYHLFLKPYGYRLLVWTPFLAYWLYLHATHISFDQVPATEMWFFTLLLIKISLILVLLHDAIGKHIRIIPTLITWISFSFIYLIPITFIAYYQAHGSVLSTGQLNAIFQTNFNEAAEYVQMYISGGWILLVLTLFILFLIASWSKTGLSQKNISPRMYLKITIALFFLINLNAVNNLKLPKLITDSVAIYKKELAAFKQELQKRQTGEIQFNAAKKEGNELHVIIIGESLNKNHMSLYGYHRSTSPNLQTLYNDGEIIKFEEAFSCHTHTVPVLTRALTEADQINKKEYFSSLSIIDIVNKAGFDSYWLSNQAVYGIWENPVSVIAEQVGYRYNFNSHLASSETVHYDQKMAGKLQEILGKGIEKNTVVFIHLMGNHGRYNLRYPNEFLQFGGALDTGFFGSKKIRAEDVNHYDNSVLYNDKVVYDMIQALKNGGLVSSCIYFADHSEDVISGKGHNSGNFSFDMVQIPMIFWLSEEYKNKYPQKYQSLQGNKNKLFPNDFIYDLTLGMMDISTESYHPEHDPSSGQYDLPKHHANTLHGGKSYLDKQNYFYYQKRNAFLLDSLKEMSRIFPRRVNNIGKLKDIAYKGIHSFELDLIFQGEGQESYFEVGHDKSALSGIKLREFLSYTDSVQKLWLDIKNLNESNYSDAIKVLIEIDKEFNIKEKAIIESTTTSPLFAEAADSGFHSSYYLPLGIIDYDQEQQRNKALEIALQVKQQKVKAISFDIVLYSFVKQHLEKLMAADVVYHTWDLSLQYESADLMMQLNNTDYYHDSRIKTILLGYHCIFEL